MSRWKTTAALFVLTVGVGTYLSRYEIRQPSPEERQRLSKEVLNIAPDSVSQLSLDLPKVKLTLIRQEESWRVSPTNVRADDDLVHRLLDRLAPLTAERTLSSPTERSLEANTFGLDPMVGQLTVVANGTPTTLWLGEATPVHSNRYVRVSDRPEIFVVSDGLFEAANHPPETFRDPWLIRLDSWLVERLTAASPASSFSLTRDENAWTLSHPAQDGVPALTDRADQAEVNALLSRLGALRITRFVDDAPQVEGLSTWGFDQPSAELTIRLRQGPPAWSSTGMPVAPEDHAPGGATSRPPAGAGTTTVAPPPMAGSITLFFGRPLSDDAAMVYAKRSDEPPLYAVAKADVESLWSNLTALRATSCFEFFTGQVTKVEVMREGRGWTMERTENEWHEVGTATALDRLRIDEWLGQLADLKVVGFVDDAPSDPARYGVQPPVGSITVWTTPEQPPQRLLVGALIDGSTNRYGRIEGRGVTVQLPQQVMDLLATPERFRAQAAADAPANPSDLPSPPPPAQ